MFSSLFKKTAKLLLGNYGLYRVYRFDLTESIPPHEPMRESKLEFIRLSDSHLNRYMDTSLAGSFWYDGDEAFGFGIISGDELIAVQWYWSIGNRYSQRESWPLVQGEVKSVHIETIPRYRGKGLAKALKLYSMQALKDQGYTAVLSRVWHNHMSSIHMNNALGAQQIGWIFKFSPMGKFQPIRLRWLVQ